MVLENEDRNTGEVESNSKIKMIYTKNKIQLSGRLFLSLIFLIIVGNLFAQKVNQSDSFPKNQIKTNPIIILFPVWNINYEHRVTANKSFQIGVSYLDRANFIDTEMDGIIITVDYKYYFRKKRNRRGYIQPYLRHQKIEYSGNGDVISQNKLGGGACLGRVYNLTDWLILDINLGFNFIPSGYKTIETDGIIDVVLPVTLYDFGPKIGVLVGVSF